MLPLTAALVFSTLGVQLSYDSGVLFDAARLLFCSTYIVQSVPLLFFTYGRGYDKVEAFGPYEAVGGHCIPLEVSRDSLDGCRIIVVFEGDLFLLGLATPTFATALRERGLTEDEVRSLTPTRIQIVGMGKWDFWYRVGMVLCFLEWAFPQTFRPENFGRGSPRKAPPQTPPGLREKRPPDTAGASRKAPPGHRRGFAKSTPLSHPGVLAALRRWGIPHPTLDETLRGCLSAQASLPHAPPCTVPRLVVNREETPPIALPDSLKLRGINTPGYYRPGCALNEEGRALRDEIDGDTIRRLDSLGCTVLARHSGWRTLLKGAVGTVELDALGVNFESLIKTVEGAYGVPLQEDSLILPSLGDGMVRCTDALLINRIQGTNVPVFTTVDLLCVSPKTCFGGSYSSIYAQMMSKQGALLREAPPQILDRLDRQVELERLLYARDPERYPDADINAVAVEHVKGPLVNGLAQALHVVMLDPVCDPETLSCMIDYLEHRACKDEDGISLPVIKFVGTARAPAGTSLESINAAMVDGHDEHLTPVEAVNGVASLE